jgi:hypothetical protein
MPTYTVHAPPSRNGSAADPQRFVFVRDGFYFWALVLTPLWLLSRRLWVVFIGYAIVMVAFEVGFYFLKLPDGSQFAIAALINILIALEAGTLQRWTYGRRKWSTLGLITGDDQEAAERRFFAQWVERADDEPAAAPPRPVAPPPVTPAPRAGDNDIIGLFPQPGGRS